MTERRPQDSDSDDDVGFLKRNDPLPIPERDPKKYRPEKNREPYLPKRKPIIPPRRAQPPAPPPIKPRTAVDAEEANPVEASGAAAAEANNGGGGNADNARNGEPAPLLPSKPRFVRRSQKTQQKTTTVGEATA